MQADFFFALTDSVMGENRERANNRVRPNENSRIRNYKLKKDNNKKAMSCIFLLVEVRKDIMVSRAFARYSK